MKKISTETCLKDQCRPPGAYMKAHTLSVCLSVCAHACAYMFSQDLILCSLHMSKKASLFHTLNASFSIYQMPAFLCIKVLWQYSEWRVEMPPTFPSTGILALSCTLACTSPSSTGFICSTESQRLVQMKNLVFYNCPFLELIKDWCANTWWVTG